MANFSKWSHENLVKFAEEANNKMIQQHEYNEHLQRQLKTLQEAAKKLLDVFLETRDIPKSEAP